MRAKIPVQDREPGRQIHAVDLILLACLGVGVRLVDLGASPFWRDEAVSAFWAELPAAKLVAVLQADVHAPLYYILLGWWGKLLGNSEWALRSLGAILGGLTPVALYWALAPTFRRWMLLGAGLLLVLNPGHIMYSQQVSVYPLWVLLGVVAMGLTLRMIGAGNRRPAVVVALGLTLAAMMYTHMWTVLFWSALIVAAAIAMLVQRRSTGRFPDWIWRFAAAQILGLVLFLPWLMPMLRQAESRTMEHLPPTPAASAILVESARFWLHNKWTAILCAVVLLVGLGCGIWKMRRARATPATIAGVTVLAAIVLVPHIACLIAAPFKTLYYPRYAMVCIPAALALVALAAMQIGHRVVGGALVVLVAILPMQSGAKAGLCIASTVFAPSPLKQVAHLIDGSAGPGDVIVIYPEFYAATFNWYYRGELAEVCYPALGRVELMNWHTYADRLEAADSPNNAVAYIKDHLGEQGKVWVVYNPIYRGDVSGVDYGDTLVRFLTALDQALPNVKRTDDSYTKGRRFDAATQSWIAHGGQRRESVILTVCIPTGAERRP